MVLTEEQDRQAFKTFKRYQSEVRGFSGAKIREQWDSLTGFWYPVKLDWFRVRSTPEPENLKQREMF